MENAVLMKIDFPSICGRKETVAFVEKELADPSCRRSLMSLYIAALAARVVLQAASGRLECVVDRQAKYLVRSFQFQVFRDFRFAHDSSAVPQARLALHNDFPAGQSEVNADVILVSSLMVAMRDLHGYPATHNAVVESVEFRRLGLDPFLDNLRRLDVPKGDLQRKFHELAPERVLFRFTRVSKRGRPG
jgi:hypothetical protein